MKLYHISHPDCFFRVLESCTAPVSLTACDGTQVGLQEYRRHVKPGTILEEVEVTTSCAEDACRLLRFSLEAAVGRPQHRA